MLKGGERKRTRDRGRPARSANGFRRNPAHGRAQHPVDALPTFGRSRSRQGRAFAEKIHNIVGLHLSSPDRAVVPCVDEKSRRRAPDRTQPVLPLRLDIPERRTHDYRRNGTTPPFAAIGFVIGKCCRRHRSKGFPDFPKGIDARIPKGPDVHIVMDNHATHRTAAIGAWPARRPYQHIHFTPTSASRINQVERWFAEPACKQLQRGTHASTRQLEADIRTFIETHNQNPKPFRWTKSADDILDAVKRFRHRVNHDCISNFNFM